MLSEKFKAPDEVASATNSRTSMHAVDPPRRSRAEEIALIRQAYITAQVGSFPQIPALMREAGLLNREGVPLTELTEMDLLAVAHLEDWRGQREAWLQADAPIPEELAMRDFMYKQQAATMLYETVKMIQEARLRQLQTGDATALDGSEIDLPSDAQFAYLAEGFRRLNNSLAVDANNPALQPRQSGISEFAIMQIKRMEGMNIGELWREIEGMANVSNCLKRDEKLVMAVYEQCAAEGDGWAVENLKCMNTEAAAASPSRCGAGAPEIVA